MTEETIMSSISREERVARVAMLLMANLDLAGHTGPGVKRAAERIVDALSVDERLIEALEPLLRFHETGGHEGDGSDERLALIRSLLQLPGDVQAIYSVEIETARAIAGAPNARTLTELREEMRAIAAAEKKAPAPDAPSTDEAA